MKQKRVTKITTFMVCMDSYAVESGITFHCLRSRRKKVSMFILYQDDKLSQYLGEGALCK